MKSVANSLSKCTTAWRISIKCAACLPEVALGAYAPIHRTIPLHVHSQPVLSTKTQHQEMSSSHVPSGKKPPRQKHHRTPARARAGYLFEIKARNVQTACRGMPDLSDPVLRRMQASHRGSRSKQGTWSFPMQLSQSSHKPPPH